MAWLAYRWRVTCRGGVVAACAESEGTSPGTIHAQSAVIPGAWSSAVLSLRIELRAFDQDRTTQVGPPNIQTLVIRERAEPDGQLESTLEFAPQQGHIPLQMQMRPTAAQARRIAFRPGAGVEIADGMGRRVADPASADLLAEAARVRTRLKLPPRAKAASSFGASQIRALLGLDTPATDWGRVAAQPGVSLVRVGDSAQVRITRGDTVVNLSLDRGGHRVTRSQTMVGGQSISEAEVAHDSLGSGLWGVRERVSWFRRPAGSGSGWVQVRIVVVDVQAQS